jgi:hypothetical protein
MRWCRPLAWPLRSIPVHPPPLSSPLRKLPHTRASTLTLSLRPEWAHSHWVWLASNVANQTSETELVEGYLKRNIPVQLPSPRHSPLSPSWFRSVSNYNLAPM